MPRRRYVSTEISLDKAVNELAVRYGDFAAMLYTWMIPHAEDNATIAGDPDELLWKLVPGRRDKTAADIERALTGMEALGLIEWDRTAQLIGFPPASFYKYQAYVGADRRRTERLTADRRGLAESGADQRSSAEKSASLSLSLSPSVPSSVSISTSVSVKEDIPPNGGVAGPTAVEPPQKRTAKTQYAPAVTMTAEQHAKLVEQFGEIETAERIERLSLYKQSRGKRYKCDYSTVLAWERKDRLEQSQRAPPSQRIPRAYASLAKYISDAEE